MVSSCVTILVYILLSILLRGLPAADEQTSHTILDRFVELGGNFIDTANAYSTSENVLGN